MAQDEILKRVPEHYILQPTADATYTIRSRRQNSNDEYEFYGSIGFTEGKLTYASKYWHNDRPSSDYKLANTLYFVIVEMEKRGERLISLRTATRRLPGFTTDDVILTFSKRQLAISATEYQDSKSAQITETIGSTP